MNWMKKVRQVGWWLVAVSGLIWFPLGAHAATPAEVDIEVGQEFGEVMPSDKVDRCFHYRLSPVEANCPLPQGDTGCELTGAEKTKIHLTFEEPGSYHYDLAMDRQPEGNFYTCDQQHYALTVDVVEKEDALVATPILQNEKMEKVPMAMFSHAYQLGWTDPELMVDPPVQKTVSGTPKEKSLFTFALTADDPTQPMPEGSQDGVKLLTIEGSGVGEFGTWEYEAPGMYYYTITEVDTQEADYVFDRAVYTITDEVTDVKGELVLFRTVTNQANKLVTSCTFINRYIGDETEETEETEETQGSSGFKKPGEPGKPSGPKGTSSPKTGDGHHLKGKLSLASLFLLLMIGCGSYLWHTRQKAPK